MKFRTAHWLTAISVLLCPLTLQATTILPLAEVKSQGSNSFSLQFAVVNVSGLPALPKAAMQTTSLTLATAQQISIDSHGQGSFTLNEPEFGFLEYRPHADILMAELPAGTAAGVGLSITMPNPALPTQLLTLCATLANGVSSAICVADIRAANLQVAQYTITVSAQTASAGRAFQVNWAGLLMAGTGKPVTLIATGPGHVAADQAFPLRLLAPYAEGARNFAVVLFDGGDGQDAAGVLPLAWTPSFAFVDGNRPQMLLQNPSVWSSLLLPGGLAPGQSMTRAYFDLPPNAGTTPYAPIAVTLVNDYYSDVDWYAAHTGFPGESASFLVGPAPAAQTVLHGNATFTIQKPQAGRWFIVVRNTNPSTTLDDNTLFLFGNPVDPGLPALNGNIATPTLAPGLYYNPQRSGHGVSLSQAGGQQMLFWYTYLEDGTPTWYLAQATAPAANTGWWTAPLYRSAWSGSGYALTRVGSVLLTPTATNKFIFTWYLEDKAGSEVFDILARTGACPRFNGQTTNFTGAWYAPMLSGYGMDVLALPEQQFNLFYLYDDIGIARWGVGNSLPFLASTAMGFRQGSGFCPTCTYNPPTFQSMGSVNIDYASNHGGNLATNLQLQPPLSGTWITNQAMQRLTGSSACTP